MAPRVSEFNLSRRRLAWLLEPSNPSARYLTLTRLLGRGEHAPEVRASRTAIPLAAPAKDILLAQYPEGYWMHPGIGYSPRYRATVWQILLLAQLGMPRCESLDRAVQHLFEANQREDGAFRASKEPGDAPIGLGGSLVWALEMLGYGDAPQVKRAWSWLREEVERRGLGRGGDAGATSGAVVKVLWAANALASRRNDCAVETLRPDLAALLLDRLPSRTEDVSPGSRLTFPLTDAADLLQWMEVLVDAGYRQDPRLAVPRAWLARRRLLDGAWPLERVPGKFWTDFGELGESNKWITIRALAVGV